MAYSTMKFFPFFLLFYFWPESHTFYALNTFSVVYFDFTYLRQIHSQSKSSLMVSTLRTIISKSLLMNKCIYLYYNEKSTHIHTQKGVIEKKAQQRNEENGKEETNKSN